MSAVSENDWLVIATQSNRETMAIANLERQNFNVYCPMIERRVRHARRSQIVRRPLFPGYLFAEHLPDQQRWSPILGTLGVRTLVRIGPRPATLSHEFINALRDREIDGIITSTPPVFQVGQFVTVRDGALSGFVGEIINLKENERALVLLRLLNQLTKAELPIEMLRAS